jgi:AcrR family transcriptional regulator
MVKQATNLKGTPRDRILEVATDLFYNQGYRATGINEVIEKSEVAKATFYNHFPSKDDLCKASLEILSENELSFIDGLIDKAKTPQDKFMSLIKSLDVWAKDTNYRGCAFINIAAEIPDEKSPLRKVGTRLYDEIRNRIERLTKELIASDKASYGHLDAKTVTDEYFLAFASATGLIGIYHDIWPVKQAVKSVSRLIGES